MFCWDLHSAHAPLLAWFISGFAVSFLTGRLYVFSFHLGTRLLPTPPFFNLLTAWAGATASVNCSRCQAGTFGTGSGEGLQMKWILILATRYQCGFLVFLYWPFRHVSHDCSGTRFLLRTSVRDYDGACRRDSKCRLQRLPGGDIWDWVR